jgi:hypothetical protein
LGIYAKNTKNFFKKAGLAFVALKLPARSCIHPFVGNSKDSAAERGIISLRLRVRTSIGQWTRNWTNSVSQVWKVENS